MTRGELKAIIKECIEEVEADNALIESTGMTEEEMMNEGAITNWLNESINSCDVVNEEAEGEDKQLPAVVEEKKKNFIIRAFDAIVKKAKLILGKLKGIFSKKEVSDSDKKKVEKKIGIVEKIATKFADLKAKFKKGDVTVAQAQSEIDGTENHLDDIMDACADLLATQNRAA